MEIPKLLAQQPGRNTFERSDHIRQSYFGWIVDQQVYVIVFAVELHQLGIKILADACKNQLHGIQMLLPEHVAPIFGYEYQMNVQRKYTVPAVA